MKTNDVTDSLHQQIADLELQALNYRNQAKLLDKVVKTLKEERQNILDGLNAPATP